MTYEDCVKGNGKMNKKQIFRDCIKYTPRFVHSFFTWGKIRKLEEIFLSPDEVTAGERDFSIKEQIVKKATEKHAKRAAIILKAIDKSFAGASCLEGVADKNAIKTDMLFCYFAYGYIPEEYVYYHLNEHTDEAYRRQYVTEITRLCCRYAMNDFTESTYSNKDVAYERLKQYFKRDAVVIRSAQDREKFLAYAQKHPRFIEKPTASSMGKGVCLIDLQKDNQTPEEYFDKHAKGGTLLLEEVIRQSDDLAAFNDSSVNTCRVATFKTKNEVLVPWGAVRMGRKGQFVDNAHQGGIFIAVDTHNGKLAGEAVDTHGNTYAVHPESGIVLNGYQLPEWDNAIELVKKAAEEVPKVQYSSWDLAHTPDKGWVVVEVNPSGMFLWQASAQKGCKEELKQIMEQMELLVPYRLK